MRLPLVFEPHETADGKRGWIRSDGWNLLSVLTVFNLGGSCTKEQKKAVMVLIQKARMAHEREVDAITINDHQIEILRLIIEDPKARLKEKTMSGDGRREVDVAEEIWNDPNTQLTFLAIEAFLDDEDDFIEEDEGIKELMEIDPK